MYLTLLLAGFLLLSSSRLKTGNGRRSTKLVSVLPCTIWITLNLLLILRSLFSVSLTPSIVDVQRSVAQGSKGPNTLSACRVHTLNYVEANAPKDKQPWFLLQHGGTLFMVPSALCHCVFVACPLCTDIS